MIRGRSRCVSEAGARAARTTRLEAQTPPSRLPGRRRPELPPWAPLPGHRAARKHLLLTPSGASGDVTNAPVPQGTLPFPAQPQLLRRHAGAAGNRGPVSRARGSAGPGAASRRRQRAGARSTAPHVCPQLRLLLPTSPSETRLASAVTHLAPAGQRGAISTRLAPWHRGLQPLSRLPE